MPLCASEIKVCILVLVLSVIHALLIYVCVHGSVDILYYYIMSLCTVPVVLKSCTEVIERYGIVDGIYRLSGISSNIQKLRLVP